MYICRNKIYLIKIMYGASNVTFILYSALLNKNFVTTYSDPKQRTNQTSHKTFGYISLFKARSSLHL